MTITRLALLSLAGPSFDGWDEDHDNLFGDDDDFGDDDFGDDDDDFGDDEVGEDDFGDDDIGDDDEVGASRRGRRRGRRAARRGRRRGTSTPSSSSGKRKMQWGSTILSDSETTTGTSASISFRLQHAFKAEDITGIGSTAGARITTIMFGDRPVFNNANGVPVELFASTSFVRNLLKGQSLQAGLDITVSGTVLAAGDIFSVSITGAKPMPRC